MCSREHLVGADVPRKRAVRLILDQALVDVDGQHEDAAGAVHVDLVGQEGHSAVEGLVVRLHIGADELQVLVHHDHAVVVHVRDIDVAVRVDGDVPGGVEGVRLSALDPVDDPGHAVAGVFAQDLDDPVVAGIRDIHIPVR